MYAEGTGGGHGQVRSGGRATSIGVDAERKETVGRDAVGGQERHRAEAPCGVHDAVAKARH
ncbi:hypothetical protein [Streptomyces griseus]|uniref:hypothetical protein n=1 Tax=Streptomyces griseus TaxID=1911 RepID=UPI0008408F19|nr:hypothetical protein [Streptomyces griseus]